MCYTQYGAEDEPEARAHEPIALEAALTWGQLGEAVAAARKGEVPPQEA